MVLLLSTIVVSSCTTDLTEDITNRKAEQLQSVELSVKSLSQITNSVVTENFSKFNESAKEILLKEASNYNLRFEVNDLEFDLEEIMEITHANGVTSYTFLIQTLNDKPSIDAFLTLGFDAEKNTYQYVQFGGELIRYFDEDGKILEDQTQTTRYGYYTPKPSNIPSKAPKSVICNYNWNGNIPSVVASYCGFYYGGTGPAPIEVLAALFPEWYVFSNGQWIKLSSPMTTVPLTNDYNDLYYLFSDGNTYPFFNLNFHPNFSQLYSEIINYYDMVYVTQLGYAINNPYALTYEEDHVHKQAFIDSFFQWTYVMQNYYPSHYSYLVNNPNVYYQIFNLFAEYNSNNPVDDYTYLGQPWYIVQYTPNQDVKCINNGSNYLLTTAGLTLMQQLGSGAITLQQFRTALPDCN